MNDDFKVGAGDGLGAPDIQTLGSSTLFNLLEEMIRLRSRNEAQHKLFEQTLNRTRDALTTSFNSFAADTQRAYQDLRKEGMGPLLVAEQREPGFASQQPDFKLVRAKVIVSE